MKLKAITPIRVTDAELVRRQARYDELAPDGVEVHLVNLPDDPDVPRKLESAEDIAASDRLVAAEIVRTDPAQFDAVLPDCVLDPGVASTADQAPVPVYGILQLATGFLAAVGHRFGAMTRNEPIAEELRACLRRYGLTDRLDEVAVLDLSFDDIEDHDTWNAAIDGVRDRFTTRSVQSVINGCSAVAVRDHGSGAVVVDPTGLALQVIGMASGGDLLPRTPAGVER